MDFIVGCNYWASNAGTKMWQNFDVKIIEKDIEALRSFGMKCIRVFPIWSDFQPVFARHSAPKYLTRYATEHDELNENGYFLNEEMLERFSAFLDICEKYGVKVIVGILTGFMSGATFIPPALNGENLVKSPIAHYFEQLFITGFVEAFSDRDIIYAWDLGNECESFDPDATRFETASWIAMIANTIRAKDNTRPIISGIASRDIEGAWSVQDQAKFCDVTTTHPYPFFGKHTSIDSLLSTRTLLHPTAQTKLCIDISGKPCLTEEIGTLGPMAASNERAGNFARFNMFSLWANGALGAMWWCAFDQTKLDSFPYTDMMIERELGLLKNDFTPKPALLEMQKFSAFLDSLDFELPKAQEDAVCLLTRNQDHWGVSYMSYILSKQAGINLSFAYADVGIPDAKMYFMPSINYIKIMHKKRFEELKKRVFDGADLYISMDNAVIAEFEDLTGLKVVDSYLYPETVTAKISGKDFKFTRSRNYILEPVTAEVISSDDTGNPFYTKNRYGKGTVYFINAPIETNLISKHNAFSDDVHLIYESISKNTEKMPVKISDSSIISTYHPAECGAYVVLLNSSETDKEFAITLEKDLEIEKVYYGDTSKISAFDACVIKLKKR